MEALQMEEGGGASASASQGWHLRPSSLPGSPLSPMPVGPGGDRQVLWPAAAQGPEVQGEHWHGVDLTPSVLSHPLSSQPEPPFSAVDLRSLTKGGLPQGSLKFSVLEAAGAGVVAHTFNTSTGEAEAGS